MKLPDRSVQKIAKQVGSSPQIVRRVLGEMAVVFVEFDPGTNAPKKQVFRLGLRLDSLSNLQIAQLAANDLKIATILSEYRNCCPVISRWIWSGGFNPQKRPDDIDKSALVHACRTAGRLRARLLREATCG